nr:two-component regulator propeller domain-containing protein [Rhodopirellula sp. SM50]
MGNPRIWIATLLILLLHAAGGWCAFADESRDQAQTLSLRPHIPFEDNIHREYRVEHGLPSNTINDVLQTRDGFVWAATADGLVRFDGKQFRTFNRSNTPDFPANNVERLYEDRRGTLWFGTEGGFARYRAGTIERVKALDDIRIMAIVQRRDGSICVGTEFDTWRSIDGDEFQPWKEVPDEARALYEDDDGTLWIGRRLQMFAISTKRPGRDEEPLSIRRYRLSELTNENTAWTPTSGVMEILPGEDDALWIGTSQGLFEFRDDHFTLMLPGAVIDVLQTRSGGLYVQSNFSLYRESGESFELLERSPATSSLAEDHEGGLWIGKANGMGLHHYVHHPARYRFLDRPVHCLLEGPEGEMWLGSNQGLHVWRREDENRGAGVAAAATDSSAARKKRPRPELAAIKTFNEKDGLPDLMVRTLARGSGATIWVGTASGLCRWTGTELVPQSEPAGLTELNIVALHESRDGALWIAEIPFKTYRLFEGKLEELTSLEQAGVKFFHEDAEGCIWVGTNQGLFREGEDRQFERLEDESFDKLLSSNFLCDFIDRDGGWWMGTRGGLVRYLDGRFHVITPGDGLASEYIERLHIDASGENFWMGGRHAFFSVPRADLEEFIAGRRAQVHSQRLPRSDGFVSWRVGARCGPTTCLSGDSMLWISDGIGTLTLPPRPSYLDLPPPQIHVDRVRVDTQLVNATQRFEFASGPRRLTIEFSAPTFVEPNRAQAQFLLKGHDEHWSDAGNERVAHYTDLKPGDYEFRVRADNGFGAWNDRYAAVAFTVNPRWWEIEWLRGLALLASSVVVVSYFRHRMRKVRGANVALRREIAERKRAEEESRINAEQLARVSRAASMGELTTSIAHEVKQPLYAIVSNAQTATRLLEAERPNTVMLHEALIDIASAGKRAADIIDHVRSMTRNEHRANRQLDLNHVVGDVIKLVDPELRKRQLSLRTELSASLPTVRGDPIELQQAILNLIINGAQAMSHDDTRSPEIVVATSTDNGYVELAVTDAGTGLSETERERMFEPFFTTKADGTGMGLAINRTIIEAHGGRIWATANADRGTTFRFSLPISSEDGQ